jgi:hypothetical protein
MSKDIKSFCLAFPFLRFINMASSIVGSRQVMGDVTLCNQGRNENYLQAQVFSTSRPFA